MNTKTTAIELAVKIGNIIGVDVPDDCVFAVFVFENRPEDGTRYTGFGTNTTETLLKQWLREWLDSVPIQHERFTVNDETKH